LSAQDVSLRIMVQILASPLSRDTMDRSTGLSMSRLRMVVRARRSFDTDLLDRLGRPHGTQLQAHCNVAAQLHQPGHSSLIGKRCKVSGSGAE
jgi:hypothetical protein